MKYDKITNFASLYIDDVYSKSHPESESATSEYRQIIAIKSHKRFITVLYFD